MKKNEEDKHSWKKSLATHNNDIKRLAPARTPYIPRYKSFFFFLCYTCNDYGHKDIDCRFYVRNKNAWSINGYENSKYQVEGNYFRKPTFIFDRTYKLFGALNYEIECYKCHNFGHIAKNCRT